MADGKSNGGFKIAFWVMTVIATVGLVGVINAVVANERIRVVNEKQIYIDITKGDKDNQDRFLLAFKDISSENKKDFKDISDKIEKMGKEITAITTELRIKK